MLDCTTVVPELSGSEFFGHERGAFTHAYSARDGAFALADGGTLFLDEVGDLPLALQAELLRVVQEHTYKRVGSNTWRQTDFRLVCATNKDLAQAQESGHFRRDLYYRIANWSFKLPPLRDRGEDIKALTGYFLMQHYAGRGRDPPDIEPAVQDYLKLRDYPGNVRELRQLVTRIAQWHVGDGPITVGDVPVEERPSAEWLEADWADDGFRRAIGHAVALGVEDPDIVRRAKDVAKEIAMQAEGNNKQRAARRLGLSDRALQMWQKGEHQQKPVSDKRAARSAEPRPPT